MDEREAVRKNTEQMLKSLYTMLVSLVGHRITGELFGTIAFPALIARGWSPPPKTIIGSAEL